MSFRCYLYLQGTRQVTGEKQILLRCLPRNHQPTECRRGSQPQRSSDHGRERRDRRAIPGLPARRIRSSLPRRKHSGTCDHSGGCLPGSQQGQEASGTVACWQKRTSVQEDAQCRPTVNLHWKRRVATAERGQCYPPTTSCRCGCRGKHW